MAPVGAWNWNAVGMADAFVSHCVSRTVNSGWLGSVFVVML
jgi:hypothetical protein